MVDDSLQKYELDEILRRSRRMRMLGHGVMICALEPAERLRQNALGARESRDVKNVFSSLQPTQLVLFSELKRAF